MYKFHMADRKSTGSFGHTALSVLSQIMFKSKYFGQIFNHTLLHHLSMVNVDNESSDDSYSLQFCEECYGRDQVISWVTTDILWTRTRNRIQMLGRYIFKSWPQYCNMGLCNIWEMQAMRLLLHGGNLVAHIHKYFPNSGVVFCPNQLIQIHSLSHKWLSHGHNTFISSKLMPVLLNNSTPSCFEPQFNSINDQVWLNGNPNQINE